jgi:hypothetical protein
VITGERMLSYLNTIIIADEEELLGLKLGSSRLRYVPRRDYSYPDFKSIEFSDDTADPTLSRKRKRTEKESLTLVRAS